MSGEVRICPACRTAQPPRRGDPLCPACTQAARQPASPLLWLFDSPLLRDTLAQLNLSAVPAIIRAATGLSLSDLAAIAGVSRSTLGLYECGHRDGIFDIRVFLQFADAVDMPREALLPLLLGGGGIDAALGSDADLDEADMDRRDFGNLAAGAAVAALLPRFAVPSSVGMSHVRYLRRCEETLWSQDQTVGGAALLRLSLRQWHRACRMLKESIYTDAVGRELLVATGRLGVCVGWLAFDSGQHALSQRLYTEARSLATAAGDPVLKAEALEQSSLFASYMARVSRKKDAAREGLMLAHQAAEEARYEPLPRLHALIALRQASAASLLGDKATFCSGIRRARRELERISGFDEPESYGFVNDAEITGFEAGGYRNLGEHAQSEKLYRATLAGELQPRNRAFYGAMLAGSLLRQGALDEAISTGVSILPTLVNGVTSIRTIKALRPIRTVAGSVGAEEFCERFDTAEQELSRLDQVS